MDNPDPSMDNPDPAALVLGNIDLVAQIISYLSVKQVLQMRTVKRAWQDLISSPAFIKLHLARSPRNANLILAGEFERYYREWIEEEVLITEEDRMEAVLVGFGRRTCHICENVHECECRRYIVVMPCALGVLLRNPEHIIVDDAYILGTPQPYETAGLGYQNAGIVGSCNGLVCVFGIHRNVNTTHYLQFWNLAMRKRSQQRLSIIYNSWRGFLRFSFGCAPNSTDDNDNNSTGIYKVVAFTVNRVANNQPPWRSEVRILNLGTDLGAQSFRLIESFPAAPLLDPNGGCMIGNQPQPSNHGLHFLGSINWLALTNMYSLVYDFDKKHLHPENFVILSLNLSSETYSQFLLPTAFYKLGEVPRLCPTIQVLNNFLCLSYDLGGREFVVWKMGEFGISESWMQLFCISYQTLQLFNLPMDFRLMPVCLSENGHTLILAHDFNDPDMTHTAIIYNSQDGTVERTRFCEALYPKMCWFASCEYVESFVPITWVEGGIGNHEDVHIDYGNHNCVIRWEHDGTRADD